MNGLKNGLGLQKSSDGSIYYGNFSLGYMHGEGVMVQKNNTYKSGKMKFGSFDHGIILYQNKTLIYSRKLQKMKLNLFHYINIESGETQCSDIFTENISEDNCRSFHTVFPIDEFYRKKYIYIELYSSYQL